MDPFAGASICTIAGPSTTTALDVGDSFVVLSEVVAISSSIRSDLEPWYSCPSFEIDGGFDTFSEDKNSVVSPPRTSFAM